MGFPKSMQKQYDKTMEKYGIKEGEQPDTTGEKTPAPATAPEPDPAPPQPDPAQPPPVEERHGQQPPDQPPSEPAAAEPSPAPEPGSEEETYKRRYETLVGKYNKEVPRLQQQIRELQSRNEFLESTAAFRKDQPQPGPSNAPAPGPTAPFDVKKYLNEDEIAEYGEEFYNKQAKLFDKILDERLNERIKNERASMSAEAREDRLFMDLRMRIPDFDSVNNDPLFLDWIESTRDGHSGGTLKDSIVRAHKNFDPEPIISIFNAWKNGKEDQPGNAPAGREPTKQNLERQVAPKKTTATKSPMTGPRIYTRDEIKQLTNRMISGQMPRAEADRTMKEIDQAYSEGRIK